MFTALQPSMWQYPVLPGLNLDLLEQTDDPTWAAQDWQVGFVFTAAYSRQLDADSRICTAVTIPVCVEGRLSTPCNLAACVAACFERMLLICPVLASGLANGVYWEGSGCLLCCVVQLSNKSEGLTVSRKTGNWRQTARLVFAVPVEVCVLHAVSHHISLYLHHEDVH